MSVQIKALTIPIPVMDDPGMPATGADADFNLIPEANKVFTLYMAPTGKSAILKGMRFVNTHTAAVTVSVWFNRPVGDKYRRRLLAPADMSLSAGFTYIDEGEITLEPGDKIQAKASMADVIQYVISGVERDTI
jgi:hypothetical protein